jgi:NAD(P)-dependent dehydrogenase (short-subunit alcohol dehydrogenase family)
VCSSDLLAELIRLLLPGFHKKSHVVNISSIGGIGGSSKFPGLSAYSSSKGALNILTEMLSEEFKDSGPSFNCLALGAVQTEMLEEAFPGFQAKVSPLEMANYIYNFSTEGNKLFNGKTIPVSTSNP